MFLEFWGSWCRPCRARHPDYEKFTRRFNRAVLKFWVSWLTKKKELIKAAIQPDSITWTNVIDLRGDKNKAALMYNVSSYPTNFLIDPSGIILATNIDEVELRKQLDRLRPSR